MRLSRYFLPVLKETPQDAQIASHRLMLRAGMIRQCSSGIYSWLPLGFTVLKKIEQIVREEQAKAGAIEMLMPTLQSADLWRESGRYDGYGAEMLRIIDRHKRDLLYGPTNEEQITEIFRGLVKTYKDLPKILYHIQWKFRDEIRPRFGVMRGREFLMKDGYSFDIDEATARISYNKMFVSYLKTFARLGLTAIPMKADTGPIGGDMSHEFLILAETGESGVYFDSEFNNMDWSSFKINFDNDADVANVVKKFTSLYAATDEKYVQADFENAVPESRRVTGRGIEVGHIFNFGTKYSEPMDAKVSMADGSVKPAMMGSYGIGVSRLVGAMIEASHDDKGIIWQRSVAPFLVGLINLKQGDEATDSLSEQLYERLRNANIDVLYHDKKDSAGAKMATIELIGLPYMAIIGPKRAAKSMVELKCRKTGAVEELTIDAIVNKLLNH